MRMIQRYTMVFVASALLAGAGPAFASPPVPPPAVTGSESSFNYWSGRASTLLAEIQRETTRLEPVAESLRTYARAPSRSWETHADHLYRIKQHVNALGKHLAEMQDMRHVVLPWQQQAITELTSHAAQVAASTEAAILHLGEFQDRLFVPAYRDHLTTIANHTGQMKDTADRFVDYEKTQQKLQQLETELELQKA